MSTLALLGIGAGSIALLLLLIIRWQVHAFVAMMLVSFLVAFATGMPIGDIISTLIAGMGGHTGVGGHPGGAGLHAGAHD